MGRSWPFSQVEWLTRRAWVHVVLLLVGGYLATQFGQRSERLAELSPTNHVTLDGRAAYSPAEAWAFLVDIGAEGRALYSATQVRLDLLFPLVYGLLFMLWLKRAWRGHSGRRARPAVLLPLGVVVLDVLENVGSLVLTARVTEADSPPAGWAGLALATSLLTTLKWLGLLAILVALAWPLRRVLAGLVHHAVLLRVPLTTAGVLLALPVLGGPGGIPTLTSLMIVERWAGLTAALLLVLACSAIVGQCCLLAGELAPRRVGFSPLPLQDKLERWIPADWSSRWLRGFLLAWVKTWTWRGPVAVLPFLLLGLPLVLRLLCSSTTAPDGRLGLGAGLLALLTAVVAIALLGWLIERGRRELVDDVSRLAWFTKRLGPGYHDETTDEVEPGHPFAVSSAAVLLLLYAIGGWLITPESADGLPAIAYIIGLLTLVCSLASGIAFFFDRFRLPIGAAFAAYLVVIAFLGERNHAFDLRREPAHEPPDIATAAQARAELPGTPPDVVTIVCLNGGGIQASGWSAWSLTGLQEALGPELTRSIQLVSSTSGGSVGAYYWLEGLDASGAVAPKALPIIRQASVASSLEATAWGLVYPDLLRALSPLAPDARRDRAWAMERAWLSHAADVQEAVAPNEPDAPATRLTDWMQAAATGRLPAVVFNSTFIEDGQQAYLTNVRLDEFPAHPDLADPTLRHHVHVLEEGDPAPIFDIDAVTAARLSASFPYVSPPAHALYDDRKPGQPLRYHLADGGYFDNYGMVAAVQWLEVRLRDLPDDTVVLFVEVRAFPERAADLPRAGRDWTLSALGPLQALYGVRSATQAFRNELERRLLQRELGDRLVSVVLQPPPRKDRSKPPLSWQLALSDKRRLCHDWRAQESHVEPLKSRFPEAPWKWPSEAECDSWE
ncbi:MAG: hypothetical protein AAF533_23185 [Acidobacteriota bacterium]